MANDLNPSDDVEFDAIIANIVKKLVQSYGPEKVVLFGSRASGRAQPDSDIDLLIIKETQARFIDRWAEVRGILTDPTRFVALEVLVLTPQELSDRLRVGDQFIEEITRTGRVLYAA